MNAKVSYKKREFARIIKDAIKAEGVSYYELKTQTTLAPNVVKSIEGGGKAYTIDSLLKLCEALGLEVEIKNKFA